ncbi:MAG: ABC transporter ATP-binding protein [Lachnospiraceae bacterium]|nr:ABC transporter ATP-binding protein [Lachnospiraceae bacterium]
MINAENISFSYNRRQLFSNLSFHVGQGECLALCGPNGCGKSTMVSLLGGILKPATGKISVNGAVSVIPQGTALFEDMSVSDNIAFFAGLNKHEPPKALPFSLDRFREKRLSTLSGGYKKLVSIACALINNPVNVLFDEPFAGLDPGYQEELTDLIIHLKNSGCSIVYVGHDPLEYVKFFDQILFIAPEESKLMDAGCFSAPESSFYVTAEKISAEYHSFYRRNLQ